MSKKDKQTRRTPFTVNAQITFDEGVRFEHIYSIHLSSGEFFCSGLTDNLPSTIQQRIRNKFDRKERS